MRLVHAVPWVTLGDPLGAVRELRQKFERDIWYQSTPLIAPEVSTELRVSMTSSMMP